jgi:hypothetical protein
MSNDLDIASKRLAQADTRWRLAKVTLREELERQLRESLEQMDAERAIAARQVIEAGGNIALVKRLTKNKDHRTAQALLARTDITVPEFDPLSEVYKIDGDYLVVNYVDHGPENLTGTERVKWSDWTDGVDIGFAFYDDFPDDYEIVAGVPTSSELRRGWIDGDLAKPNLIWQRLTQGGNFYYDEASEWVRKHGGK